MRVSETGCKRGHTTNHSSFGSQLSDAVAVSTFADEVAATFPPQGRQKGQLRSLKNCRVSAALQEFSC